MLEIQNGFSLIAERLNKWLMLFYKNIPNLVVAIGVFLIALFISRLVRNMMRNRVRRWTRQISLGNLIANAAGSAIVIIGLFIALSVLNLDKTVTSLLAGAGIVGLAIGFAFQDLAQNFIGGVIISFKEPYKVGDLIKTTDYFGVVEEVGLRTTQLGIYTGQKVIIPNKFFLAQSFENFSRQPYRLVEIKIRADYNDDLEKVREAVKDTVRALSYTIEDAIHTVDYWFQSYDASSIDGVIRFWVKSADTTVATSEAIIAIKKTFLKEGLHFPFPTTTLAMKTVEDESTQTRKPDGG